MSIEKNQMAEKDAKRKAPKRSFVQNKKIRALLQQASDMMQQDSDRAKIWFETKWMSLVVKHICSMPRQKKVRVKSKI